MEKKRLNTYDVSLDTCPTITVEAANVEEAQEKATKEYDKMSDKDKLELLASGLEIGSFINMVEEG